MEYKPFNMSKVVLSEKHLTYNLLNDKTKSKLSGKKVYVPTYFGRDILDFCINHFDELRLKCIYFIEKTETEGVYNNHIFTPDNDIKIEVNELKTKQLIMLSDVTICKTDEGKSESYLKQIKDLHRDYIAFARIHQTPTEKNKGHYFKDVVISSFDIKPEKKEKFSPSFKN